MIRRLTVAALMAFGAASIVSCGGTDLVRDDTPTDDDATDEDTDEGDPGDAGPLAPVAPQLNIQVYDVTSTTMLVRWTHEAPASCCTYKVYYSGAQSGPFTLVGEGTEFPRVTGLTPETPYYVYVIAVRDGLESPSSVVRAVLTKPGLAPNFRVARIGGGGVVLAWDAVDGASGFNVYRSEPGSTEVTDTSPSVHVAGSATSATVLGLDSNSAYAFKMNVEKGVFRLGDLSPSISATTDEPIIVTSVSPDYGFDEQQVTITGERFGSLADELTLVFEGENGPGDERVATVDTASDTTVTAKVPVGSKTGRVSVRRFIYAKESTPDVYTVGPLYRFDQLEVGEDAGQRVLSLSVASGTHVLAGTLDGTLRRTTNGNDFVPLDYASALTGAKSCDDTTDDTSVAINISGVQCIADDCLVARGGTCNAVRIAQTFGATPEVTRKRIGQPTGVAIGPTRWLACGNSIDPLGCLSVSKNGSAVTLAYVTDFVASDFTSIAATLPSSADFGWSGVRGRSGTTSVIIAGVGTGTFPDRTAGLLITEFPYTDFVVFGPGEAAGADCSYDAAGAYCVGAVTVDGLERGVSAGAAEDAVFAKVLDVPASGIFNDVQCTGYQSCIAVGIVDQGQGTESGLVAQTFDGQRWFWRRVGERELRVVSCVPGVCYVGDVDGGIWRGDAPPQNP
ncbi:MAG: fibronectin type III domain-containing protein [Myxococcota bacterium]|nr:fibronectin type III domain-containing protein [Myxococcota bacterium]